MSTPDPQQAIVPAITNSLAPAAYNSDQAKLGPSPNLTAPDRSSSQQSTVLAHSMQDATAAQDDRHATTTASAKYDARDGESSGQANVGTATTAMAHSSDRPHSEQQGQAPNADQAEVALLLWDPVLQTLADGLDDVESTRIAQANRYRILTATRPDEDGEVRGFGLAEDHPAVAALNAQLKTLEFLDAQMSKALQKQLRAHPLFPLVARTKGLGDKTVARLLASVRDPYWNDLHNRPRTVGELFAFCGVAGPGYRRQRGVKVNWNPDARKRLWIIATTIVKVGGPYRAVYDAGRERYADKTHTTPCVMCGKKGRPAETSSDWRDGHKHAGAVRLVMREVLRDLWTESRAIYDAQAVAS